MNFVHWFCNKEDRTKAPVKLKTESDSPLMKIPMQYVCISPSYLVPVLNDELQISSDKIRFHCNPNSDILKPQNIEIHYNCIIVVQYSDQNNLLRVTLKSETYKEYFSTWENDDVLFSNSVWFCLKIADYVTYKSIIDNLSDKYLPSNKLSILLPNMYDLFKSQIYKVIPTVEYVTDWDGCILNNTKQQILPMVEDNQLIKTFEHISLSKTKKENITKLTKKENITKLMKKKTEMIDEPMVTKIEIIQEPMATKIERVVESKKNSLKRNVKPLVPINSKRLRMCVSNRKFLYAPSQTQSIEITSSDLDCLNPRQYLNDNIINFYMTYIYHEVLTNSQREASYFFNVFFNTKLIGTDEQQRHDTPNTRHARVAKWTKKVDIFAKDFIVIPVIEDQHWFLVIVCFPWMAGVFNYAEMFKNGTSSASSIPINKTEFATKTRHEKCLRLVADQKVHAKPCILIFDSLELKNRSSKVNIIRDYLKSEWDSRRSATDGPLIFDKTTCRGYSPIVLKQNNGTDCGLYLLQYVESFFMNSLKDYSKEAFMAGFMDWFKRKHIWEKREFIISLIKTKTREIYVEDNEDDDAVNIY